MKKKQILILLAVLLCLLSLLALAACAHTHAFGEWTTVTAATCGTAGEQKRTCACGESETLSVAPMGEHTYHTDNVCTQCNLPLQYTEGLIYEPDSDITYKVAGIGTATATDIVIPIYYEGLPVTSIGNNAFAFCNHLTSVTIPKGVTDIGNNAFYECSSLASITIPASVKSIGGSAFSGCTNIIQTENGVSYVDKWAIDCDKSVTEVLLRTDIVGISDGAFSDCSNLVSITIPTGVTNIGSNAFYHCSSLTSVKIPSSVTGIGSVAFLGCSKLIEVYNLSSLNIQAGALSHGYVGLYAKNIYTSATAESKLFTDSNGYIFYDDGTNRYLMGHVGSASALTLPSSCNGKDYKIYQRAFYYSSLTSVTIPVGVTSIGSEAFYRCSSLMSITIPSSVTSIGEGAFSDCSSLTSIAVESGNTRYHSAGNCLIETENKILVAACENSVIPTDGSVTSIGNSAFLGCIGLTSIAISAGVTSIGEGAFESCSRLTSITIPAGVTSIGSKAFYGCRSLTEVVFDITEEWWCASSSTATSGTEISATALADPATAATYLKSTYLTYCWKRG